MKKLLLTLMVSFIVHTGIQAQTAQLWGITHEGGVNLNDNGTLFSIHEDGTGFTLVHGFLNTAIGFAPVGTPLHANNGLLYGLCQSGGAHSNGCIYSFDPATNIYSDLYDFTNAVPMDGLVEGINGNMYGVTMVGCVSGGYLFCYNFNTHLYSELHDFTTTDMHDFSTPLYLNNKLYGTTFNGGSGNQGVLYCYDLAGNSFSILHNFVQATGSGPMGSLIRANDGKLYGMTEVSSQYGALFSYDITNNIYTKLMEFDGTNGTSPYSSLTQLSNGKLAGAVRFGGVSAGDGVLFTFNPIDNTCSVLHTFHLSDGLGATPFCNLFQGTNGILYGTTTKGGTGGNWGTVFSFDLGTNVYTVLHSFDFTHGGTPYGALISMPANTSIPTNESNETTINIFPCPTTDVLSITNIPKTVSQIEIITMEGEIINALNNPDNGNLEIDVASLSPGIYGVLMIDGNASLVRKFIKY